MKQYRLYIFISLFVLVGSFASWFYMDFLKSKRDNIVQEKHQVEAQHMRDQVSSLILLKQKSTVAMALSLANDKSLALDVKNRDIVKDYYKELIEKLTQETLYQNIWIQIFDKNINTIYRSWSPIIGDNLSSIRADLPKAAKDKKIVYSTSAGRFNLSLKALVPIFYKEEFVGIVEVISHFNSISKELKRSHIDSVVILSKEHRGQIDNPFTNLFIDNYYVANFDAPHELRERMQKESVESYITKDYKIIDDKIVSCYELRDVEENVIGHYVMFKKITSISNIDLDYFMFKWLTFGLVFVMGITIFIGTTLFVLNRRQKEYFYNIINSTTNIIFVSDSKVIIDANKMFFNYFNKYKTLEEFKKEHKSIGEYFIAEDEYLKSEIDGVRWVKYLVENQNEAHKVKLDIDGKIYFFNVGASKLLKNRDYYAVVLSDITEQEVYKKELELLSTTDELTKIGNRRFFEIKLKDEIGRAQRYSYPFSLIMLDIDFFKVVNDTHGHDVGDEVLIEYTKLVEHHLREADIFCRVGGEEFMVILPYTSKEAARETAEKLRIAIEKHKKVVPITMSFGVVEFEKDDNIQTLYKRVDEALYSAKRGGRNMVVVG